jgi:hypothetical protein
MLKRCTVTLPRRVIQRLKLLARRASRRAERRVSMGQVVEGLVEAARETKKAGTQS